MKRISLCLLLSLFTALSFAQILNGGFENWSTTGSYMEPSGWKTANIFAGGGSYPASRSGDKAPNSTGNYSLMLRNNPAMGGFGIAMTSYDLYAGPVPSFAVSGHPTAISFWYKYNALQQDSMYVAVLLYSKGQVVAAAEFKSGVTKSAWTQQTVQFPEYTEADSGSVVVGAYMADGPPPAHSPKGASTLWLDELAFAAFSGIKPVNQKSHGYLVPNPVNKAFSIPNSTGSRISIYDLQGRVVQKSLPADNSGQYDVSSLSTGEYLVEDNSGQRYKLLKK